MQDHEDPVDLIRRAKDLRWWALRHELLAEDLEVEAGRMERHAAALVDPGRGDYDTMRGRREAEDC